MDLLALLVAAVVLAAALVAAVADSPRAPGALVACTGAVYLVLIGVVGFPAAEDAVREIAPTVGFLVLILLLGSLADTEGVFIWAAAVTARSAGRSAVRLFTAVTALAAVVTAALSLDATVVLLTPVVLAAARRMRVPASPHGWVTGHLANSGSLLMPVSNLTNLLAFAATGLSFLHFTALMLSPWLVAVAVEHLVLRRVFRAELAVPVAAPEVLVPPTPVVGLAVVAATVLGFGAAAPLGVSPLWPAALGVAALAVRQVASRRTRVGDLVDAASLPFALFVFGLAVVVLAVRQTGLESLLTAVVPTGGSLPALLAVASVAAIVANLVNNLPATLALLPVAAAGGTPTLLAALIGVNVGPNLTYVGSLANLLWRRVMGTGAPTAARFSAVGLRTVPLTLLAATTALWLALQVT